MHTMCYNGTNLSNFCLCFRDYTPARRRRSVVVDARTSNNTRESYNNNGHFTRRLLADSAVDGSPNTGIANPTICLALNEVMMFSVSNEHYPVYDKLVYLGSWILLVYICVQLV